MARSSAHTDRERFRIWIFVSFNLIKRNATVCVCGALCLIRFRFARGTTVDRSTEKRTSQQFIKKKSTARNTHTPRQLFPLPPSHPLLQRGTGDRNGPAGPHCSEKTSSAVAAAVAAAAPCAPVKTLHESGQRAPGCDRRVLSGLRGAFN